MKILGISSVTMYCLIVILKIKLQMLNLLPTILHSLNLLMTEVSLCSKVEIHSFLVKISFRFL